jgi:DNA-directed RNA polymerase specialized sigma subunit
MIWIALFWAACCAVLTELVARSPLIEHWREDMLKRTPRVGQPVLTAKMREHIHRRLAEDAKQTEIAVEMKISQSTVSKVKRGDRR